MAYEIPITFVSSADVQASDRLVQALTANANELGKLDFEGEQQVNVNTARPRGFGLADLTGFFAGRSIGKLASSGGFRGTLDTFRTKPIGLGNVPTGDLTKSLKDGLRQSFPRSLRNDPPARISSITSSPSQVINKEMPPVKFKPQPGQPLSGFEVRQPVNYDTYNAPGQAVPINQGSKVINYSQDQFREAAERLRRLANDLKTGTE